ncbi:helix-turn-helix domain-containing protein [Veillonella sp.]|uniref:helix-turn-helix domain-containing protein n=1 Tax=Veillonella sp. TaxID=1926307 RepID=UPI0025ECC1E1|nr:helix-turn-helix domain-containing protein [Veillonella sp.]
MLYERQKHPALLKLHPKNWTQFLEVQFFMSKYSKEVKEKAIYLSEKGWGLYRIAKELEVPESTVRDWLHKFKLSHNLTHKIGKQIFSADFKRKVLGTRWKDKLSFKETAELFTAWQKRYLDERILGLQPKPKGRPPMKTKKEIKLQIDSTQKSDKVRIKELEAENVRLKYEISFYDDFMKEMREIAKPNRSVKKSTSNCHRKIKNNISSSVYAQILWY